MSKQTTKKLSAKAFVHSFHLLQKPSKKNLFYLETLFGVTPQVKQMTYRRGELVSHIEVLKHLKALKKNKSTGLDMLPPAFLKDTAKSICKPISFVINLSLKTGIIPNDFKKGKVFPIYKSGSKSDLDNYRPITVLSSVSKILEKCVSNQLTVYLEENNLLSDYQFGFRSKRSTEMAASLLIDEIKKNMDAGELTGAVFIDLSKAFDTLSHASIIDKLPSFGIHGTATEWFTDYLFARKQSVQYDGFLSDEQSVYCGVPQGSILGPLLFIMHFNSVCSVLQKCKILKYADDTVLYVAGKDTMSIEKDLQCDLRSISSWLQNNELVINLKPGKTEAMLFGTSQKMCKNNHELDLKYDNTVLNTTKTYKYLGVLLDQHLKLSQHLDNVFRKAKSRLQLLNLLRPQITSKTAITVYNAMIIPLFTYCSSVAPYNNTTYIKKLDSFQCRANHIINRDNKSTPHKMKSITELKRKQICVLTYKCANGLICKNFDNYFEMMSSKTRNSDSLLRLPKARTESYRKSFQFFGAKMFNELPIEVRKANSLNEFKALFNKSTHMFFN